MMEMTERLIECVREQPCLYDSKDLNYKNIGAKLAIWEEIGRMFDESGEAIKTKWKNLRDNYVRHKKELTTEGTNASKYINWRWASQLQFLDTSLTLRETTSASKLLNSLFPIENSLTSPPQTPPPYTASPPLSPASILTSAASRSPKNRKRQQSDTVYREIEGLQKKQKQNDDAVEYLFLSYAQTFKNFSERNQIVLKLELAKLFADTELREIDDRGQDVYSPTCAVYSDSEASAEINSSQKI